MKVHVGLVMSHGFPVPCDFLESLVRLQQYVLTGEGNAAGLARIDAMRMTFSHAFPTDVARNEICRLVLDHDKDADYLLFLDADMTHPPDTAHRLVARGLPLVTGRYVQRKPPFLTVAMRKTGPGDTDYDSIDKLVPQPLAGLHEIHAAGAGVLLIHREVLAEIREVVGDDWFRYQDGPGGLRTRSEDMWFFECARERGFKAYLDADVRCKHVAQFPVDEEWSRPWLAAWRDAGATV